MLIFDVKIKPTWFSRGYDMRLYALPKMTGLPPTCLVCGRQFPEDNHDDLWGENWGSRIDADARGSFMGQVDDSGTGTVAGWDCRYPHHQPSWDGNPGGFCQILFAFVCDEYVGRLSRKQRRPLGSFEPCQPARGEDTNGPNAFGCYFYLCQGMASMATNDIYFDSP